MVLILGIGCVVLILGTGRVILILGTGIDPTTDLALPHVRREGGFWTVLFRRWSHSRILLLAKPHEPGPSMTTPSRLRSGSTASYLSSIADGDLTAPQAITRTLANALAADDFSGCIKNLPGLGIDPQAYIDGFDKVRPWFFYPRSFSVHGLWGLQAIDILSPESDIHNRCVRALSKVCGIYGLLPDSHKVKSTLTTSQHAIASGGFSDIWKATDEKNEVFAIKVLRMYENNASQVTKVRQYSRSPPAAR